MPEEYTIDPKKAKDLWKDILAIADKYAPAFATYFLTAINKQKKALKQSDIVAAILTGNAAIIDKVLGWEKSFAEMLKMQEIFKKTAFKSAEKTAKILEIPFNPKMSYSFRYINEFSGLKIKNINTETYNAINELLKKSFKGELTVDETALKIKSFIGLDERRINALLNYEQALLKDGYRPAEIQKLLLQKQKEYIMERAITIARTESMSASNYGNIATYKDMVERGIITKDKYWLAWMITPDDRLCNKCRAMKSKFANIGDNFYNESAKSPSELVFLESPPLHPRCRCTTYLVKK